LFRKGGPSNTPRSKPQKKLWPSLLRALRRPTRWSSLAIAVNMLGKVMLLILSGRWPFGPAPKDMMRGIDFYPWKDLMHAIIIGARGFKAENGYLPSLLSPVTFNEHIFIRKFLAPLPIPSLADKLIVREFVGRRVGEWILPKVVWRGENVDTLFATKLPKGRHVLKANHGCQWNLFLDLPDDLVIKRCEIEQQAASWLVSTYGYESGEWQYSVCRPELFLEEFIDFNGARTPDDYKLFCFHGKVCLVEIDVDRFGDLRSAFYMPNWEYIPVTYGEAPIQRPRPSNLDEMIRVAEAIAEGMDFARVDLYTDGVSRLKFGEITFTPGDAGLHFSDKRLDQWLGAQFAHQPQDIVRLEF
jgi:TupA-like ATPgrasp